MIRGSWLLCILALAVSTGCGKRRMVTVEFPEVEGSTDYWVCEPDEDLENPRDNTGCRTRKDKDLSEDDYNPGLHAIASVERCKFGIAKMEILIKGSRVKQLGFVCALEPAVEEEAEEVPVVAEPETKPVEAKADDAPVKTDSETPTK